MAEELGTSTFLDSLSSSEGIPVSSDLSALFHALPSPISASHATRGFSVWSRHLLLGIAVGLGVLLGLSAAEHQLRAKAKSRKKKSRSSSQLLRNDSEGSQVLLISLDSDEVKLISEKSSQQFESQQELCRETLPYSCNDSNSQALRNPEAVRQVKEQNVPRLERQRSVVLPAVSKEDPVFFRYLSLYGSRSGGSVAAEEGEQFQTPYNVQ